MFAPPRPASSLGWRCLQPFVGVAALALAGCTGPSDTPDLADGGDNGSAAAASTIHGYLSVERQAEVGGPGEAAKAEGPRERASATFLRVQEGTDPDVVAGLLGVAKLVPSEGRCVAGDVDAPAVALHTLSPVELVQVGEVVLRRGTQSTALVARAYPDVAHLLSGVVYTSAAAQGGDGGASMRLQVAGNAGVAAIDVDLDEPALPTDVKVNGLVLGSEEAVGDSGELLVSWALDRQDDPMVVDVLFDGVTRAPKMRCVASRGGSSVAVPRPAGQLSAKVTVHRLRAVTLEPRQQARVKVQLDVSVSARVQLAQPG